MSMLEGELTVGVLEIQGGPTRVQMDLHGPCDQVSFVPDTAIELAQLLVKHARLAGYTGPFTELPLHSQETH